MREVDDVAVAVGPLGLDDDAVGRRAHGLSDCGADVDRVVRALLAGERIGSAAEAVGEDAVHRRDRRRGAEELRLRYELLLEHGEVFVDLPRAERHLVDVVAIRILAEVRGTQTAHAALAGFIEAADAGHDGELVRAIFDRAELGAQRFDRLAEAFVRRLQLAVLAAQLRQLVRLRQ